MEEKLEVIQVWLALAEEKLEVARELLELSRFDDAVSKAYLRDVLLGQSCALGR